MSSCLRRGLRNIRGGGPGSAELVADGGGGLFSFANLITNQSDS